MEQLVEKYDGKVNVIFKHYIVHPEAKVLAEAAQCV
jgi:protein-disulfide isomerase